MQRVCGLASTLCRVCGGSEDLQGLYRTSGPVYESKGLASYVSPSPRGTSYPNSNRLRPRTALRRGGLRLLGDENEPLEPPPDAAARESETMTLATVITPRAAQALNIRFF